MSPSATSSSLPPPLSASSSSPLHQLSPPSSPAFLLSTALPRSRTCSRQTSRSTPAAPPLPLLAPHTPLLPPTSTLLYAAPPLPSALLSTPMCTSRTPRSLLLPLHPAP